VLSGNSNVGKAKLSKLYILYI